MEKPNLLENLFSHLLDQTLEALQDPLCSRDKIDNMIGLIIEKINFFHKVVHIPIRLQDFIHLAKSYFVYERHSYGSVLVKDKEPVEKFYILLKGKTEKICQRPYNEIGKELQKKGPGRQISQIQSTHLKSLAISSLSKINGQNTALVLVNGIGILHDGFTYDESKTTLSARRRGCLKFDETHSLSQIDLDAKASHVDTVFDPFMGISSEIFKMKDGEKSKVLYTRTEIKTTTDLDQPTLNNLENNYYGKEEGEDDSPLYLHKKMAFKSTDTDEFFTRFLKDLVVKNACLKEKFFIRGINRVKKSKTYLPGQYFGENFHTIPESIENSIVAISSEEAHLLTISKESFKRIMAELYKKANEKVNFFHQTFPSLNDEIVKRFSHYFSQKHYKKDEVIYSQKDCSKEFYLLEQGDVTLLKELEEFPKKVLHVSSRSPKSLRRKELSVVSITKNQFFGEEILLGELERQYSAISKSCDTVVYFLDTHHYDRAKRKFPEIFKTLRAQAYTRFEWRQTRVEELIEQQKLFPTVNLANFSLSNPKFIVPSSPKPKDAYYDGEIDHKSIKLEAEHSKHKAEARENITCPRIKSLTDNFTQEDSPIAKNLALYKTKFSRKTRMLPTVAIDVRNLQKTKAESPKVKDKNDLGAAAPCSVFELNVQKDIKDSKTIKIKFSKCPSHSEFRLKSGSATTRASESKNKDALNLLAPSLTNSRSHDSTIFKSCVSPCASHGFESPKSDFGERGFSKVVRILQEVCSGSRPGSKKI